MVKLVGQIIENRPIEEGTFEMIVAVPPTFSYLPGQFLHVRVADSYDPLLRRPLSIAWAASGRFGLIYRVSGRGMTMLSRKRSGESLDFLGPLGQPYPLRTDRPRAFLVGGGIGVPPLLGLAEALSEKGISVTAVIGAQTKDGLLLLDRLQPFGKLLVATDDGSVGFAGTAVQCLEERFGSGGERPQESVIYACGPLPMLRALDELAQRWRIPGYLSVEESMACGVGACLSCVVLRRGGPGESGRPQVVRTCVEGPVFASGELLWEAWEQPKWWEDTEETPT
ncbi:MAG: dihydroorotate dehydrogenase electron transfer subunit [Firmicutes bacterium]|nr:dihydroorotate dehydrogenase electron transfer subunit [Bacillota bacterium]